MFVNLLKFNFGIFSVWILGAMGCSTIAPKGKVPLTILHTNDVHARLLPINDYDQTCNEEDLRKQKCYGGVAKRFSKIEEIRKKNNHTLLVDAGDQFQGTLFYTKFRGQETSHFMNKMGYAAMAVGNHEFDDGPAVLSRFIKEAKFPVLSANIDVSKETLLAGLIKPYHIVKVNNEKIGIIGCTTEDVKAISSPGNKVQFLSIEESLRKTVYELKEKDVNKIILLSHAGFMRDVQIAKNVSGIDVIVAGHSNTYLSNKDKLAEGPYPVVVNSPQNEPVLLVSAYAYGKFLGYLDLEFDDAGKVIKWQGEPILLDHLVLENSEIKKDLEFFEKPLNSMRNEVIAYLPVGLEGGSLKCRHKECSLGDVLADAILEVAKPYGAIGVLMNGGGIRAGLNKGKVTRWEIIDALPFANEVAVFDIKGKDLWDSIDTCVSKAANLLNEGAACFPQVAGLRYEWSSRNNGYFGLDKLNILSNKGKYEEVQFDKTYRIASNRFMLIGGDGYHILFTKATRVEILSETLDEVLINYLKIINKKQFEKLGGRIFRK